jgi:hypothetical protein
VAAAFQTVPEWTSWENQGGNVAAADLDGDGNPELIVLRVDHPTPGPNAGFYRVGRKLSPTGAVAGGWGPWLAIPGWGSAANQGAALAVADLDRDGRPDLVVFQVEHREPGPNRGRFQVGRGLDAQGNVTGGWSGWQDVPGWVSWQDQGAAVALGDLDSDRRPELVVFHIDDFHSGNPTLPNKGFYRVGFGLTADGAVARWSDWQEVQWFSWLNQGAGAAIADLDGDGRPELILYQVDRPGGTVGFHKVGWEMGPNGLPRGGWSPWLQVQGSDAAAGAVGGFTLATFPGGDRPRAVVFYVDDRPGENAGLYAVLPLELDLDKARDLGVWRLLPYFSEVLPVHAALLHTGKVLFFAGSGNNFVRFQSPDFGNESKQVYTSVVWDFDHGTFDHPPTLRRANGSVIDFFCGGHCFLPDGRILVAGGTEEYDLETKTGFHGSLDTLTFDPVSETWSPEPDMAHGRWYPTLVMLPDGRAVATSGIDENGNFNGTIEVRQTARPGWGAGRDFNLPLYPHLFVLADGRLFFTGGKMDTAGSSQPFRFDLLTPTAAENVGGLLAEDHCNQAASVLLAPAQAQRFMILGGGPQDSGDATDRVDIIDLSPGGAAVYQPTAHLNFSRLHVNAVLLPDGAVLAIGGAQKREASEGGQQNTPEQILERLVTERWDASQAAGGLWTPMAAASVPRLYHSVALLLPDGRVVSASGNPNKGTQVNWLPPDPQEEMRLEIYSPPYLFRGPRPEIQDAPAEAAYGGALLVRSAQAGEVASACLIRSGLTTHSFNGEQRLVDLPILGNVGETLRLQVTSSRTIASPGWYMLFLLSRDGVPSVARWVHLG